MAGRVYAGNLSWSVGDQDLHDYMSQAGDVKSAQVIKFPDGRSKGWGLVEFSSPQGAELAIQTLSDQDLLGRKIFIREDRELADGELGGLPPAGGRGLGGLGVEGGKGKGRGKKPRGKGKGKGSAFDFEEVPTSGTALYVGNLPWSTTWQQLKAIFAEYNVKFADVKTGFDGRSRGYGAVRFDSEEDAASALALNGYELEGRQMLVRFDKARGAEE